VAGARLVAIEPVLGSSVTYIVTGDPADPVRICSRNWEPPELTSMQLAARHGLAGLPS